MVPVGQTSLAAQKEASVPKPSPAPTYLRAAQVAAILQVSPKTVSRWAAQGKLPFLKTLGGHRRYSEDEIRALLADATHPVGE
jgi:excisionase family DNA binding protein